MWALRRAANPIGKQRYCMGVARVCCMKLGIASNSFDHAGDNCEQSCFVNGSCLLPFPGGRSLSSQTGEKTSDSEADLEDGFSELESPAEPDKAVECAAIEGATDWAYDLELSEDGSEDDSAEAAETTLGLPDIETDTNGDKSSRRRSYSSPLFKVITDAPRPSVSSAIDQWVGEGNPMGRTEISMAMLNLRKRRLYGKALQFWEWLEANKRLDFVEGDYASRLDLIAKVHGLHKAEKYIEKIPGYFRGEVIYRTLLANCVTAMNVKKAEEVFNKMRDHGFPLTPFACNQLLLLYKRLDQKKIADVLLMMHKENVKPSLFTFKLLVDTKGRWGDIVGMEHVLENMKAEGIEPDILIQSMVARHYIFSGFNDKAEAVLKEMEGDDIKENRGAWKSLLPLYAALGKEGDVGRIWKFCEGHPRFDECQSAIEAWGKLGQIESSEEVFEKMLKTWKKLSSKYYNTLLKVYANHKLLAKGKELAKRMSDNGCRIGPSTWDALVKLYVEAGEVEKADLILQKAAAQQNQSRPLYSSYMAVMERYAKRGDIHNAEKLFHRFRQSGYVGRMRQYQCLLQAYINAKAPAYGFRERMKADNMFPNRAAAAQLANVDAFRKTQISELLD